jgi:hypothetical protein
MATLTNSSKALSKPLGVHVDTVATGFIETRTVRLKRRRASPALILITQGPKS